MHSVQASLPIENSEILDFFLHGIQALEKHITDSLILKPLRFNLGDLIQPHGADGLDGRFTLGKLPRARLAAGTVDRIIRRRHRPFGSSARSLRPAAQPLHRAHRRFSEADGRDLSILVHDREPLPALGQNSVIDSNTHFSNSQSSSMMTFPFRLKAVQASSAITPGP